MHPPGSAAVLGNRQLERHLRRLPHDPRQAAVRHAVRVAADRDAGTSIRRPRSSASRAKRAMVRPTSTSAPIAVPLRRYALHLTGDADSDDRPAARLDPRRSSQVCGQCHGVLGVLRRGRRARRQRARPALSSRRRPAGRRASSSSRRSTLDSPTMQALARTTMPDFVRDIFWSDGMVRATGREYNGLHRVALLQERHRRSRTLSCFSCHTMHQTRRRSRGRRASGRTISWKPARAVGNGRACSAMHDASARDLTAHTHHRADPAAAPATTATCRTRPTAC